MEYTNNQPPPEPTVDIPEQARRTSLRFSVWDACLYASMAGFGELYFIPLLVAINASNFLIGAFTAIPQLFIAFAQLGALICVERFLVRKPIILAGASAQALFIGFMLIGILTQSKNPWLYVGFACGYYASVGFTGPAWNSLMGDLTTAETRASYFGRRGGLSQLVLFLSMISAGLILQHFDSMHKPLIGFGVIFAASFLSRSASVYALTRHYEVPYRKVIDAYFSIYQFVARTPKSNFAHFVFFVALMSLAVQVSAPFFATYMLRDLKFSYIEYTISQGAYIVAQFIAMRQWGPFADRYGNRLVLRITSAIMPIIPILWLFSWNYFYIIGLQILAGLTWGGWFLCTATFMFDAVTPPKRARCAAYLNFFNCIGIFVGAMLGGYVSKFAPQSLVTGVITIVLFSPLQFIFLLSGVLRLIVVLIFMPTVHEVRDVERASFKDMFGMLTNVKQLPGLRYESFHTFDTERNEHRKEP